MLFCFHHLIKLVESSLFRVQFHHVLEDFRELTVNRAIYQIVNIFLLLEHILGIVLQILIRHVVHAILGKLRAGGLLWQLL